MINNRIHLERFFKMIINDTFSIVILGKRPASVERLSNDYYF
jgi:hypothetical protein